jgi:hypothetical protein
MKRLLVTGILAITSLHPAGVLGAAGTSTLYVLNNPQKNQWCGYVDEKRWQSDVDTYNALEVASIEFQGTSPRIIKITEEDDPEAGDWAAYDTYTLASDGTVISLQRTTNVLPGYVSRTEIFERQQGKLVRSTVKMKSLGKTQQLEKKDLWFPNRPLVTKRLDFPFSRLIQRIAEIQSIQPLCLESQIHGDGKPKN